MKNVQSTQKGGNDAGGKDIRHTWGQRQSGGEATPSSNSPSSNIGWGSLPREWHGVKMELPEVAGDFDLADDLSPSHQYLHDVDSPDADSEFSSPSKSSPIAIDTVDSCSWQPELTHHISTLVTEEMSPPDVSPCQSYATITPLQPLPPISAVSDKFVYAGHTANTLFGSPPLERHSDPDDVGIGLENSPHAYGKSPPKGMSPPHNYPSPQCAWKVEEIDTKELARQISAELKRYNIPQSIFAERILHRSQGTLSDLLRNPKPWSKLKGGRETFRRMWKWLQEPEFEKLSLLKKVSFNRCSECGGQSDARLDIHHRAPGVDTHQQQYHNYAPHISQEKIKTSCKRKDEMTRQTENQQPAPKKQRVIFTDIQRRTLQAIFKETKRPSKDMQVIIANNLGLEPSTVGHFFMNARRRSMDKWKDEDPKNPGVDEGHLSPSLGISPRQATDVL
ncbi:one cut domain family member 2 [Diachasma alloeum]|uniref:one cut domain family member 2 n=1 Tax=Diachasma alloeum TaxID=454923 RepID=UPI000738283C|nr:one cut domain family member 2 [Diachasma alloeum]